MIEDEKDVNMLEEDFTCDQVMNAKNKRHSWHQTTSGELLNDKLVVRSRYRSGSFGSCHDLCKQGHKSELETKTKASPVKKPILRTQSERKYFPEDASCGTLTKSEFRRLSLPETKAEQQSRLQTKEIKRYGSRQRSNEKPILPLSASCKSKPPTKKIMSIDARKKVESSSESTRLRKQLSVTEGRSRADMESCFGKSMLPTMHMPFRVSKTKPSNPVGKIINQRAQESVETKAKKKTHQSQIEEKGSSTWKMKFKKATASVLSSGNVSPEKLLIQRPDSATEDLGVVTVVREEPLHESGAEQREVTINETAAIESKCKKDMVKKEDNVIKEIAAIESKCKKDMVKKEDNVIKETAAIESKCKKDMVKKEDKVINETAAVESKCKKDMVKALVGAFEALITFGDRKSLVAASAS